MKTTLYHLQVNIDTANTPFYRDLLAFLGWDTLYDADGIFGAAAENGASLWFVPQANTAVNDYDGPGVNHISIGAPSQVDVDATVAYLQEHGCEALFETPRHRPEFSAGPDQTYYQVMFRSPDNVLFEVVYTGPKQG